jgi:hypothetical protein
MVYASINTLAELKAALVGKRNPSGSFSDTQRQLDSQMDNFLAIMDAMDALVQSTQEVMINSIDLDLALAGTGDTTLYTGVGSFDVTDYRWTDAGSPAWTENRWSEHGCMLLVSGNTYNITANKAGSLDVTEDVPYTIATDYTIVKRDPELLDYLCRSFGIIIPDFATPTQKRALLRTAYSYNKTTDLFDGWLALKNTVDGWETYLNTVLGSVTVVVDQDHLKGRRFYYGKRGFGYPSQTDIDSLPTDDNICTSYYSALMDSRDATVTVTGTLTTAKEDFVRNSAKYFVPMVESPNVTITFIFV